MLALSIPEGVNSRKPLLTCDEFLAAGFAAVFCPIVAILFMIAKPYRPDLKKDSVHDSSLLSVGTQSWWTGELNKKSERAGYSP